MDQTGKRLGYAQLTQILLLVFVAECTFGGSGRWLEIGPLSIRMILFALCFFATLPFVFRKIRSLALNFQVIVTVAYGVYLLLCAWIGLRQGNRLGFIWADISTLLTLALVPGFFAVMTQRESIDRAVDVVYWAALLSAVATVALHFLFAFISQETFGRIYEFVVGRTLGGIASMETGMQRVYLRSQMFLQIGIIYGVWKLISGRAKHSWLVHLANGLMFTACILSYTRGFWLGLAAGAALLLLLDVKYWKAYIGAALRMIAVFLVCVVLSSLCYRGPLILVEIVNRVNPNLVSWEGEIPNFLKGSYSGGPQLESEVFESNAAATALREETLAYSRQRIRQHPVLGNGLGANLDEIRDDGRTEYMYLDQIVKTGAVGTALFALVFFSFVGVQILSCLEARKKGILDTRADSSVVRDRFLTAAYLGLAVTSYFNPFLNNPMGIMLLLVTSAAVYNTKERFKEV